MNKRQFAKLLLLSLMQLGLAAHAQEAFPSKPITIVVPYAGGGSADALARMAAEILTKELGHPVIVDSKPGAGGSIGLEAVVKAPPDGHTLVLTASGSMAINPFVYKLRYNPVEDLASVTVLVDVPFVVVANGSNGIKDLAGLRRAAAAKPGSVTSGNAGVGTQAHLTQELFQKAAGIRLNVVPYKGSAPAITDLLGGQIDTMIDNIAAQATFIRAGKVQPLFVTSAQRSPALPQVPTAVEAGLPGFTAVAWFGLAAPKNTSPAVVNLIQRTIAKGFAQADYRTRLEGLGFVPVVSTPLVSAERARKDLKTFGEVAKQIDLKPT